MRVGFLRILRSLRLLQGGLISFFKSDDDSLKEYIIDSLVNRAVSLIAWKEVGEVLPYYCEGLIHLDILFKSEIIKYKDKIEIDYSRYYHLKEHYIKTYKELAQHYIDKQDALLFLEKYVTKKMEYIFQMISKLESL